MPVSERFIAGVLIAQETIEQVGLCVGKLTGALDRPETTDSVCDTAHVLPKRVVVGFQLGHETGRILKNEALNKVTIVHIAGSGGFDIEIIELLPIHKLVDIFFEVQIKPLADADQVVPDPGAVRNLSELDFIVYYVQQDQMRCIIFDDMRVKLLVDDLKQHGAVILFKVLLDFIPALEPVSQTFFWNSCLKWSA